MSDYKSTPKLVYCLIALVLLISLSVSFWVLKKTERKANNLTNTICKNEQLLNLKIQLLTFFNPPFSFNTEKETPIGIINNPCLPDDFKKLHIKLSSFVQEKIDGNQKIRREYKQYERQDSTDLDPKYINEQVFNKVDEERSNLMNELFTKYGLKNQNKKYQELITNFLLSDVK